MGDESTDPDETLVTTSTAPTDPRSPELPGDRFTQGAELGRGGMGRVFAARDHTLDRTVAIKHALGGSPVDLARFEREARITARLEHPSIVPIHEAGHDAEGRPYYVMRKIEGQPLSDRIEAAAGVRDRLALVPNVLAAVEAAAFAHARGVIHRDIKPLNILVGAYGETLLIDWGLARQLDGEPDEVGATPTGDPSLTEAGHAYGTPGYMAPEQARGEQVDPRADVYQLGATLFHVLAGVPPFEGIARSEWVARAILGAAPQLERIGPEVPAELVAIVAKAMRVEPGGRYRDAGELAIDLRRFLTGQLVAAHRYTARERIARFVRRHRLAVAISAIAVVAAAVLATLAIGRILHERDRANAGQDLAAERAERLLLDHAATLAVSDPTRAVAMLANLPADSASWPRARDIASAAAATGIRRGVTTPHVMMTSMQISPDGARLATAANDAVIQILELATAATRSITVPVRHVHLMVWIDDRTLALTYDHDLDVLDVATGQTRRLASVGALAKLWLADPAHLRYFDEGRKQIIELAIADAHELVLASGVVNAEGNGDLAVYEVGDSLRVLTGTHERTLREHVTRPAFQWPLLAISRDHARIASVFEDGAREFAVATGELIQEVALPRVTQLFYGVDGLYAVIRNVSGTLVKLHQKRADELLSTRWTIVWIASTTEGTAIAGDDGTVLVLDRTGLHQLPVDRTELRLVAARPGSPYVAVASLDGTVTWWDLRAVAPTPRPVPSGTSLCGYEGDALYFVDRTTSARRLAVDGTITQVSPEDRPLMHCDLMIGHHLIVSPGGIDDTRLLDIETGASRLLSRPIFDHASDTLFEWLPDSRTVTESPHGDPPPRVRWRAPGDVKLYAVSGPWLAAQLVDGSLRRVDAGGQATFVWAPAAAQLVGLGPTGDVWTVVGPTVWRWRDGVARPIVTFVTPVAEETFIDGELIVVTEDHSIWELGERGPVERTQPGKRHTVFGDSTVLLVDKVGVTTLYPATGVTVLRRISDVTNVYPDAPRRALAVVTLGSREQDYLTTYADPVPAEPAAARAWVLAATNAVLDPVTDAMTWR